MITGTYPSGSLVYLATVSLLIPIFLAIALLLSPLFDHLVYHFYFTLFKHRPPLNIHLKENFIKIGSTFTCNQFLELKVVKTTLLAVFDTANFSTVVDKKFIIVVQNKYKLTIL
ncbi:hypothetical protein [Sulfurovum mangrovi]|uniref:hypothetical protein n=1 Tax=Sulfurovum mangrovi TaxID=2893889 RepID=UPI001E2E5973|nr:hypothetical protein [Sulfurovum mangrovi]UFH59626.1 hypothetical protein LN246_01950 [Sulfurovum mangrovi]UFH60767.1 hypothetical protein LN246_14535 [Sulfurovum mangrovi]